jgi:hypothetical protein
VFVGFISALVFLGCGAHHERAVTPEAANWTCGGKVTRWRTGQVIPGVQVIVQDACQVVSDSSGRYMIHLGPDRDDIPSLRFSKQDYVEVVAMLDSATVVGERSLSLDVIMLSEKDLH